MEYLSMKKVIHGDLSARNILLSSELNAKISDFGLSKKMYQYSHCSKNGTEPLPWRWLALESLKNLQFSTASDVWSYAILLWEIFTLGEQPYPGVSSLTNNFILNLEQGLRPTLPPFSTSDIYNMMSSCWDEDPTRRPSFVILKTRLQDVEETFKIKASTAESPCEELRVSIDNKTCNNLHEPYINRIVSIKVSRNCAQLYDELNCNGNSIQISWFSPSPEDLGVWDFHNKTQSVIACQYPCVPDVGSSVSVNNANDVIKIEMYSESFYKGKLYSVNVQGCTHLNESLMIRFQIGSIKVPSNECVLAFIVDGEDLDVPPVGTGTDADCVVGSNKLNVVEFRDGMPKLDDFQSWGAFRKLKFLMAFSPCQCNRFEGTTTTTSISETSSLSTTSLELSSSTYFSQTSPESSTPISSSQSMAPTTTKIASSTTNMTPTTSKLTSTTIPSYELYIEFYSKPNFGGKSVKMSLNFTDCKNLFEGEFAEWEGVPQSMKVSNGSCVEVYKEHFCSGSIHVEMTMAVEVPDLSQIFGLGERIRSLQTCNKIIETTTTTDGKENFQEALNNGWSSTVWITIAGICAFIAIALTLVLIRFKKRANSATSSETLSEKEIEEFMKGLGLQMGFIFNEEESGTSARRKMRKDPMSLVPSCWH
ncbi:unnamed protein product [Orchesella dallaii]|uniref:Protein kinase domain-containing protein n=1 Tax=Orchesella dallaii TaxID=48710 RepID=A0ABP1QZH1_9HEXA